MTSLLTWEGVVFEFQTVTCYISKGIRCRLSNDTAFLSLTVKEGAGMTSLNVIQLKPERTEQGSGA